MAKEKYTTVSVWWETKKTLDSVKGGKSYNRLIEELVEFWKKGHGTGRLKRIRDFFGRSRR